MGNIDIHQHTDLEESVLLAAWPGISNVALEYDLAHIDVAQDFKVKRIYTCAAALVQHITWRGRECGQR
ncbi:hypothetical protein M1N08_01540 [Dehalococcoidia bacterium]|nr:hypothetical protein [Dehalococcoidia bacterium]